MAEVAAAQRQGAPIGNHNAAKTLQEAPQMENKGDNVTFVSDSERGNKATYLASRLKRDHPEIAAAVERGEYKSIRADCFVVNMDDLTSELAEIDENLMRSELSAAQRDMHLARRQEIWRQHKEKSGIDSSTLTGRGNQAFASETAGATGITKQAINRSLARAKKLGGDMAELAGTSLDRVGEMDALAKLPIEERRQLIDRARKGEKVSARKPVPAPPL